MKKNLIGIALLLATYVPIHAQQSGESLINNYLSKKQGASRAKMTTYRMGTEVTDEVTQVRHLYAQQEVNGIPLQGAVLSLHLRGSKEMATDQFVSPNINKVTPTLSAEQAIMSAMTAHQLPLVGALNIKDAFKGAEQKVVFAKNPAVASDYKAQLIFVPVSPKKDEYRLAWLTQIYTKDRLHYWVSYVDAENGKILKEQDMVLSCNFGGVVTDANQYEQALLDEQQYQRQVRAAERMDKTIKNREQSAYLYEVAVPENKTAAFLSNMLAPANTYLVLKEPAEAPIDNGMNVGQTSVTTAGDITASPYGWTSTDGTSQHTYTRGNNAWAFYDPSPTPLGGAPTPATSIPPSNNPPSTTGANQYIYPWDLSREPAYNNPSTPANAFPNRSATTVNLFYWNNLIHDVFYKTGFTEGGRNFQSTHTFNLIDRSNGGLGNDEVLAQSQDGGGTNNANFLTLADGVNGQMQMYLWTAAGDPTDTVVRITSGSIAPRKFFAAVGSFATTSNSNLKDNPVIDKAMIIVRSNAAGATPNTSFGCGISAAGMAGAPLPPDNATAINGQIAVVDRGNCNFSEKVLGCQAGGAAAVIVINNADGAPIAMGSGDQTGEAINIPAVMISKADGKILKDAINAGPIRGDLKLDNAPSPMRDGSFDNGVVAHEYGHGISTRTSSFADPSTGLGTLGGDEQGGEGWSDFWGLYMTTTASDLLPPTTEHPKGVLPNRGIGNYVTYQNTLTGGGIRPRQYSISMTANEFTYAGSEPNTQGISSTELSAPHGIGFVWCTMLYELTQAMVDIYGMDTHDIYKDGTNINPIDPNRASGLNVANRLILEGIRYQGADPTFVQQRDGILKADTMLFAGLHGCAIWKAFAKRGLGFSASSVSNGLGDEVDGYDISPICDPNQVSFSIKKTIPDTVANGGLLTANVIVTNKLITPAIVLVVDTIPDNCTFMSATNGGTQVGNTVVWSNVNLPASTAVTRSATYQVNTPTATTLYFHDNQDGATTKWATASTFPFPASGWAIKTDNPYIGTKSWFAIDPDGNSEQTLRTATSVAIPNENGIKMCFFHHYATEATFDGGMLEQATAANGPWTAITTFDKGDYNDQIPPENTPIAVSTGNPDGDAFGGSSGGYVESVANLDAFKNTARFFRFRFISDVGTAATGWWVDNVYIGKNFTFVGTGASATSGATSKTSEARKTLVTNTAALPVELLDVTAKTENKNIRVDWTTVSETNNKGFKVERSSDNTVNFREVGFVKGNGNSNSVKNYTFVDNNVTPNTNYYYRLRQIDNDDKETVSKVVTAILKDAKSLSMNISPNPASDKVNITLGSVSGNNAVIRIFSLDGRLVATRNVAEQNTQTISLDTNNLAKGVYTIELRTENGNLIQKLVVQ